MLPLRAVDLRTDTTDAGTGTLRRIYVPRQHGAAEQDWAVAPVYAYTSALALPVLPVPVLSARVVDVGGEARVGKGAWLTGSNWWLRSGESITNVAGQNVLTSCNGRYTLTLKQDGDLVAHTIRKSTPSGTLLWSSGTSQGWTSMGERFHLTLQSDGNLVLYQGARQSTTKTVLWATGPPAEHAAGSTLRPNSFVAIMEESSPPVLAVYQEDLSLQFVSVPRLIMFCWMKHKSDQTQTQCVFVFDDIVCVCV